MIHVINSLNTFQNEMLESYYPWIITIEQGYLSSKTKFVSGKVFYNRVSDAFMGPGNHEFQVNPVKFTKTCKIPYFTVQLRSRWPTHLQNLCTFFSFFAKKGLLKGVS